MNKIRVLELLEELYEVLTRHHRRNRPQSIGLVFPFFNTGGYSVNQVSIPQGMFVLATPAYLNADGTPSVDSAGNPIPIVGPLSASSSGDVTVVVNPSNTISLGMSATATVGGVTSITVTDPNGLTGEIQVTALVKESVPASIDFTFGAPQTTAPTG